MFSTFVSVMLNLNVLYKINLLQTIFIYSYSSLMKCFFSPQKFCVVYLNLTGYQMKA